MSNLPIRVRLTAWYALLLAAIIVGIGVFVVRQLDTDLRRTVDRRLQENTVHIGRAYHSEGPEDFVDASGTALPSDGSAQILDSLGEVLHHVGTLGSRPIVPPDARAAALAGRPQLVTVRAGRPSERFRLMVTRVDRLGKQRALVVAASLQEAEESVERVLVLLLLAGPAALLATALGGWLLARQALRPVGRMTQQADQIGIDHLDERIAVPRSSDELGHLAVTLNAMLDRLQTGVQEKHRLIADASHELRTPLAVMRAEIDVSLRNDALTDAAQLVLESSREEVDRMSRTVDNLLTLAQVDEGRLELLTSRIDLRDAVDAAARPLRPLAEAKDVRLEVGGEDCDAVADPQRLHHALTNFIENAIKFTQPGGQVTVESWRQNGEVGVTVTDNGPGMPHAASTHVFDRFFRADHARGREAGGSGLGLAICHEIATAHGGRVWVDSEEGAGSRFSLALPSDSH